MSLYKVNRVSSINHSNFRLKKDNYDGRDRNNKNNEPFAKILADIIEKQITDNKTSSFNVKRK